MARIASAVRRIVGVRPYIPDVPASLQRRRARAGARGGGIVGAWRVNGTSQPRPGGYDTHGLTARERRVLEDLERAQAIIRQTIRDMRGRRAGAGS